MTGRLARSGLAAAAMAAVLAAPVSADTLAVLAENTLVVTALQGDDAGETKAFLFRDDDRLEQTKPGGGWASGFWRLEDGLTCITARGEAKFCLRLEPDLKVGDMWTVSGPTGTLDYSAEIRAGRIRLNGEKAG